MYMHELMCICGCECAPLPGHIWKPEVNIQYHSLSLAITFFVETGASTKLHSLFPYDVWPALPYPPVSPTHSTLEDVGHCKWLPSEYDNPTLGSLHAYTEATEPPPEPKVEIF